MVLGFQNTIEYKTITRLENEAVLTQLIFNNKCFDLILDFGEFYFAHQLSLRTVHVQVLDIHLKCSNIFRYRGFIV